MAGKLEGKVAIVTGGGSGFGAEISRHFADAGANVLLTDISEDGGSRVAAEKPAHIKFFKMDVTSSDHWKAALDYALKEFGKVDILVNNAGWTYRNKPTEDVTEEEWERVFNINVKGVYLGCNTVIPKLIEQGKGGSVINIASTGASRPRPGLVWYNATKGAVANATKGLAAEYGKHQIRVNSICPLLTSTALFEAFVGVPDTPENRKQFIAQVPMGRIGEVDDVARSCVFLASEDAKFITGVNLKVDGGKCI